MCVTRLCWWREAGTVGAAILWCRVGARAASWLYTTSTCYCARAPVTPGRPRAINWNAHLVELEHCVKILNSNYYFSLNSLLTIIPSPTSKLHKTLRLRQFVQTKILVRDTVYWLFNFHFWLTFFLNISSYNVGLWSHLDSGGCYTWFCHRARPRTLSLGTEGRG